MIYQFPHCAVVVTVDRVSTIFPVGDDPEQYPASSRGVTTDVERTDTAQYLLAAHLLSYAIRGTPSPHTWLAAGRSLGDDPLFVKRVEAGYDAAAEAALVAAFVCRARREPHTRDALAPILAKVANLDAFLDRFAWFAMAPNYVNLVKL